MKNLNFTKNYKDQQTINSNNYAKFEVNWPRGSQFTAGHTKNRLQFDE
jgi:coproporphyrinogen III oxidase